MEHSYKIYFAWTNQSWLAHLNSDSYNWKRHCTELTLALLKLDSQPNAHVPGGKGRAGNRLGWTLPAARLGTLLPKTSEAKAVETQTPYSHRCLQLIKHLHNLTQWSFFCQNKGLLVMLHSETSIITENVTWKTFLRNESLSHRLNFRILETQCSVQKFSWWGLYVSEVDILFSGWFLLQS